MRSEVAPGLELGELFKVEWLLLVFGNVDDLAGVVVLQLEESFGDDAGGLGDAGDLCSKQLFLLAGEKRIADDLRITVA